jgi:ferritin
MMNKRVQDAMNEQIKNELYSGYLYLSMSAFFESLNLSGFAHWLRVQAVEEQEHAMKFYDFIHDAGGRVNLRAIEQPPAELGSPTEAFEQVLAHEQKVTAMIHELLALAVEEKDYASQSMLQWFVDEQVEEERNATSILETLKMVGEKGQALVMVDRELAQRSGD